MDFLTILKGLQVANAALGTLPGLIEQYNKVRETLSSDEQNQIDSQLRDIQARNDAGFLVTDAKLEAASRR